MNNERQFSERPLDELNKARGQNVLVELKNGQKYNGVLKAFDMHLNIVLDKTQQIINGEVKRTLGSVFIRGDTIVIISYKEE